MDEDKQLLAQRKIIQDLRKRQREQYEESSKMQVQNHDYRTMIIRLLSVFEFIEESEDMPSFEYQRFVSGKVKSILSEYGHASEFVQRVDPLPELEKAPGRFDD